MLILLPLALVLGVVAGIYLRARDPALHRSFLLVWGGFLCGLFSVMIVGVAAPWLADAVNTAAIELNGAAATLRLAVAVLGCISIVVGAFTLVSARFAPKLLELPFARWLTIGGLEATQRNRMVVSACNVLWGSFLVLAAVDRLLLSLAAAALSLPFAIALMKIGLGNQSKRSSFDTSLK
jgi:hypothetical protein